jgi:tRNA-2-methylthio-N6-dimethylallyladenosine synthase
MKKLYIQTHGCQINQYDSQRIAQVMGRMDYVTTERVDAADLVLLNTCSVRDKAEQKVYSVLGTWKQLKECRRGVVIGVCGCVAQQEGENLLKRVPYLDLVFGTHNIHKLPEMVEHVQALHKRPVETAFYRDPFYMEDPEGRTQVQGPRGFVIIMQGCNKVCSFCIVPHVRGRELSRPSEKVLHEIEDLARRGIKEVMLLGQNVNSYGKFSERELSFAQLLKRVNEIEGLARIRFTTSHPQDLSPDLIEAYVHLDKLCEHLHLPVQSGADSVLSRMRRGYTKAAYLDRIHQLRDRCPEVSLSTDIIVGFPGETDEEFGQTLVLLNEVQYDEVFSFMYSPRPQTVSTKIYKDDVPEETKKERLMRLQSLQQRISLRKNREKIGTIEEILVDGPAKLKNGQMMGRTRSNRIVNFAGSEHLVGTLALVRITGATANSLLGESRLTEAVPEFQPERVMA